MGLIINADTAADTFRDDEKGKHRLFDHIKVLSKAAEGYVHVLEGLRKHVHRYAVMTMILKKLNGGLREGFIIAAVKLHSGLVYNHFAVLYHMYADVLSSVETEGPDNGDVGPDGIGPFPVVAAENPVSKAAGEASAESDHNGFLTGLFREVGGIGGLAGAGDAKINIQLERMLWMADVVQEEPGQGYPENVFHNKTPQN